MIKQKMKAFSKFAFKGVAGAILVIYTLLFGLSFCKFILTMQN